MPRLGKRTARLGAAVALTLAPITVGAVERVDDRYERKQVRPGELISRTVACPRGADLTGGGYHLSGLRGDHVLFQVTANYPLADDRWRVELRNVSGEDQALVVQIYALCDD